MKRKLIDANVLLSDIRKCDFSGEEKMAITFVVNRQPSIKIIHSIGEAVYCLASKYDELGFEIRDDEFFVDSIRIDKDGIEYLDADGENIEEAVANNRLFWTIEEAKAWLDAHMPPKLSLKIKEPLYVIHGEPGRLALDVGAVERLCFDEGIIKYDISLTGMSKCYMSEEEIQNALNNTVFRGYKKALAAYKEAILCTKE